MQNTPEQNAQITEENGGTSFYFEGLRTNRASLLYHTMCFMRRLSFGMILAFLKGEPIIQVFAMAIV